MDPSLGEHDDPGPSNFPSVQTLIGQDQDDGAPRYRVAHRHLAAVEIPAVVENVDRAIKAF
ncbi:hypothetical protein E4U53_007168, partial [Claviceps sorghi]